MPRVVLYTKADCSLCDDARALLEALGQPYEIGEDPERAAFAPVIEVDGVVVSELAPDERAVRRALKRAKRGISPL